MTSSITTGTIERKASVYENPMILAARIVPTILILVSVVLAMASEVDIFVDFISVVIVAVPAIAYGLSGSGVWNSQDRLRKFGQGAVLFGWLGALIGAVFISNGLDDMNALGPAISIALLTVVYGYLIKAVVGIFLTEERTSNNKPPFQLLLLSLSHAFTIGGGRTPVTVEVVPRQIH